MLTFEFECFSMHAKLSYLSVLLLLLTACGKNNFESKPKLTLVSAGPTTVRQGNLFVIQMEVADAEGDVQDSIFIRKVHVGRPACIDNSVEIDRNIPNYPSQKNTKFAFNVTFLYNQINGGFVSLGGPACPNPVNDTSVFKIWVKDKAGNRSDTITTDRIVFLR